METLKARRAWTGAPQNLGNGRCHPRQNFLSIDLQISIDAYTQQNFQSQQIKIFHTKTTFKQNQSTSPALQKALEGKLEPDVFIYSYIREGNQINDKDNACACH